MSPWDASVREDRMPVAHKNVPKSFIIDEQSSNKTWVTPYRGLNRFKSESIEIRQYPDDESGNSQDQGSKAQLICSGHSSFEVMALRRTEPAREGIQCAGFSWQTVLRRNGI